jgi:hypothetical protein
MRGVGGSTVYMTGRTKIRPARISDSAGLMRVAGLMRAPGSHSAGEEVAPGERERSIARSVRCGCGGGDALTDGLSCVPSRAAPPPQPPRTDRATIFSLSLCRSLLWTDPRAPALDAGGCRAGGQPENGARDSGLGLIQAASPKMGPVIPGRDAPWQPLCLLFMGKSKKYLLFFMGGPPLHKGLHHRHGERPAGSRRTAGRARIKCPRCGRGARRCGAHGGRRRAAAAARAPCACRQRPLVYGRHTAMVRARAVAQSIRVPGRRGEPRSLPHWQRGGGRLSGRAGEGRPPVEPRLRIPRLRCRLRSAVAGPGAPRKEQGALGPIEHLGESRGRADRSMARPPLPAMIHGEP